MKFPRFFSRLGARDALPTVVVFAGGMGTQIIQAAVYFSMKKAKQPVFADLSYFDTAARIAEAGKAGELTHWYWQLEPFGLPQASFEVSAGLNKRSANILRDGPRMMELGLQALGDPDIQSIFKEVADVRKVLPEKVLDKFLCIHVRRGDYVNVASHLIPDSEFIGLARRFSGLIESVVILSDSPIPESFRSAIASYFESTFFLDNIDPYTSHQIMRSASILVCSNSTFSLTAAALNPDRLIIIPKQWFGESGREIEARIHARCSFQLMK